MEVRTLVDGTPNAAQGRASGTIRGRGSENGSQVVSYAEPQIFTGSGS
jgi:hypothetical protein